MDIQREPIAGDALSVILIAHNEGQDCDEVVKSWLQFLDERKHPYEILFVDDGSTDGTSQKADALAGQYPHLRVFHHVNRSGLGAALRTGVAAATSPLLFYAPASKQYRPADLQQLLDHIDKVDLVVGYRVWQPPPPWRVWLDQMYAGFMRVLFGVIVEPRECWLGAAGCGRRWLARWIFGVCVPDPECPFALLRRSVFERIPIQCTGDWAPVEILAKANFQGCLLAYAPISWIPPAVLPPSPSREERKHARREIRRLFSHPDFGPVLAARPEVQPESPIYPIP